MVYPGPSGHILLYWMVPGRGQSSQSEPQPRPPLQQHSDFVTVFLLVDDCWHIVCRTSVKQKPFLLSDNRNSPVRHNYSIALNVCITWLKTHVLIDRWLFQPRSDWPLALSAAFWLAAGSFSPVLIGRWLFQPCSDWPLALSAAFWLAAGSFSRVLIDRWLFQPRSDWPLALLAEFWLAAGSFSRVLIGSWLFQPRSDWPLALSAAFWLAAGSFSRVLIGRWLFQPRSDWLLALSAAFWLAAGSYRCTRCPWSSPRNPRNIRRGSCPRCWHSGRSCRSPACCGTRSDLPERERDDLTRLMQLDI